MTATIVRTSLALLIVACVVATPAPLGATEVKVFQVQSQKAFLAGTFDGASIDPTGRLRLADRAERMTTVDEPFLLSAATHPDGWVVGTGNDGKVLLVDRSGTVKELFSASEGQVFAVYADPDGTVWAGVSPGGKVYRIAGDDEATLWFETGETYVWDLARAADGALLVATGTSGKLFRVTGLDREEGDGEVLYDSDDTHVRTLLVDSRGGVVLGTAGEGLILRLGPNGSVRTLHDSDQPEVVAFAEGPDGTVYAAVIASEASQVDLSGSESDGKQGKAGAAAAAQAAAQAKAAAQQAGGEVQVVAGPTSVGSRPATFSGKRAELLSISPGGLVATVGGFDDETVFDLLWARGRLWVATGLEGKLYSFDGEQMVLEQDLDERQIVALLADTPGPAFATTNAPAVYRLAGARRPTGTYTSAALDAGGVARFGTLRWWGDLPDGARLELSARSGLSAEPDATWSDWTAPRAPAKNGELALGDLPRGRYVQWRLTMTAPGGKRGATGEGPTVDGVELSYRQANLRPEVTSFEVMDPGQILVPAGFNPTLQVFEPVSPTRDGIFTTLEKASPTREVPSKTLWKKGYRTFRWKAEDPNGDELVYALEFRPLYPEGASGAWEEGEWMPVAEELTDDHYSFDATVLPDGVYRFRLAASDEAANVPGEGLVEERISEPVVVDHSAPALVEAARRGDGVRVVVEDGNNPLRSAEISVDAGEWRPASASDGLLDARREVLDLSVGEAAPRLLLLRVTDAAYNVVTFDLSDRL